MKIAITGHTKGIGKCLFEELVSRGHTVCGYSRSNGYDINETETRKKILEQVIDFDVFINNAYAPDAQFRLLQDMTNLWSDLNKIIINVGSKSIYSRITIDNMKFYVEDKQRQVDFIQSRKLQAKPQILNLILGITETEMSSRFESKKINPSVLSKFISDVLTYHTDLYIQDLTIDVAYQDWRDIRLIDQ